MKNARFDPIADPRREQQHIQLARDLAEAFKFGIPHLGPVSAKASILHLLSDAGVVKAHATLLPWDKMFRQISAVFGPEIYEATGLDARLRKVKSSGFAHDPAPDSMVLLALLMRAYGSTIAAHFRSH